VRSSDTWLTVAAIGGLGDSLLCTPFVKELRLRYPGRPLRCVCSSAAGPIFEGSEGVDRVIACDDERIFLWAVAGPGDVVFCPYARYATERVEGGECRVREVARLWPNRRERYILDQMAAFNGMELVDHSLRMPSRDADAAWAREELGQRSLPVLLVHSDAGSSQKRIPGETVKELATRLAKGFDLVQLPGQPPDNGIETLSRMPSLTQSAALFALAAGVVTVDSFPLHLAAAVSTPAVGVFGATRPDVWLHPGQIGVRSEECEVCADTPRRRECCEARCMAQVTADDIAAAVVRVV